MNQRLFLVGALLGLAAFDWQPYAAVDSTEAVMTFTHEVEFTSRGRPSEETAREKIRAQVNHLFGSMSAAAVKAVPRGNERISDVRISVKDESRGAYRASYSYRGTIVLQGSSGASYRIALPVNPDRVYRAGLRTLPDGETSNPCTDAHYQSEDDFWYFWNPDNPGCALKEGVDFQRLEARVRREANTAETYPEYPRLVDGNGVIRISILMGMDDPSNGGNPDRSRDVNAKNYRGIRATLEGLGFQRRVLSDAEVGAIASVTASSVHVEELTKKSKRATVMVLLFFGPSGIDEESAAFHHFFRDALENSSVVIYDGHSGLGGHLDLESIEKTHDFEIRPNRDRYQIYFFNSCSSYTYYNTMFFGRKRTPQDPGGTRNLEILTNGLATYFSEIGESDMVLVQAIDSWASGGPGMSYQKMAAAIDSDNLFGVNGDEDNPTVQPR